MQSGLFVQKKRQKILKPKQPYPVSVATRYRPQLHSGLMWNFKQINCKPVLIHTVNIILIDNERDDINNLACYTTPW